LLCGGLTSIVSAVVIGKLVNLPSVMIDALYAKSVTAPIGMGIAERIGASPTLTAVYALITGVIGAAIGRYVLDWLSCKEWWQRGFAIGTGAHGLGTTRAFSVSAEAGSFSSLAMGMHGIAGALLIPWVKHWF
jgi:putative effector of murein hydrolase